MIGRSEATKRASKAPADMTSRWTRDFAFITDTANWLKFWPGFVPPEPESTWGAPDDTTARQRILGRERTLTMTVTTFEPNQIVTYTSTQPGLPDARHERVFERDGDSSSITSSSNTSREGGLPASSTDYCCPAASGVRSCKRSRRSSENSRRASAGPQGSSATTGALSSRLRRW